MTGPLSDRLALGTPILLDGALGTELDRRGVATYLPLWSALGLTDAPQVVRKIHEDYVLAGADVLITNTFRTTRRTLEKAGRDGAEAAALTIRAVELAREVAESANRGAMVAGSIAPLEECYSPWMSPDSETAFAEHREQAELLARAGVDFLMIETMPLIREAVVAARAALATGLEVTVGFVLGDDGRILSGESVTDAVAAFADVPVSALLINCSPLNVTTSAMDQLSQVTDRPFGAYANLGTVEETVGWHADDVDEAAYAREVGDWIAAGAMMVGGCCGTQPKHIAATRRLIQVSGVA